MQKKNKIINATGKLSVICLFISVFLLNSLWIKASEANKSEMSIVKNGKNIVPIIISSKASRTIKNAAKELADYLEKISGIRPKILKSDTPAVASAIWLGAHQKCKEIFPKLNLEFKHPEEILIACNGKNLLITGKNNGAVANAVYTFLQDYLGVRWLWPGELGEDILPNKNISFKPFEYRFYPPFHQRDIFRINPRAYDWAGIRKKEDKSEAKKEADWKRLQRNCFGSLHVTAACHGFAEWWKIFHKDHPEYFALQPDGSRSGFPAPKYAKLCESNPEVWKQWCNDAEKIIKNSNGASSIVLRAAPNDGHSSGICVCKNCLAWDNPDGKKFRYMWSGENREYVAMSDRYVTFWNHLAQLLKQRYPERDDLLVLGAAYGPSKPAPIKAKANENIIISFVGFFPLSAGEDSRKKSKSNMQEWARKVSHIHYRPNLFFAAGGVWGFPDIALNNTIEDFRFLADIGCEGIAVDTCWGHWATQGPQYYLMSQLAWNPYQDGKKLLSDYYQRGFGNAAEEIAKYWQLMETARNAIVNSPDYKGGNSGRYDLVEIFPKAYTKGFFIKAESLISAAEKKVADGPEKYRHRIAFVRSGFEFTRMMIENIGLMKRARESRDNDLEAAKKVAANWEKIKQICIKEPFALNYNRLLRIMGIGGRTYMGSMRMHLGPPREEMLQKQTGADEKAELLSPEKGGWKLAFSDDFFSNDLSKNWRIIDGKWSVKDGFLISNGGTLLSERKFSGFQRLEFDAITDMKPTTDKTVDASKVSDISPFIHARAEGKKAMMTGYLFQFGGYMNKLNQLYKNGEIIYSDNKPEIRIAPGKKQHVIVENDGGRLRMFVDGRLVLGASDKLSGGKIAEQKHIGFYFYTPVKVRNVKVYTKPLQDDFI